MFQRDNNGKKVTANGSPRVEVNVREKECEYLLLKAGLLKKQIEDLKREEAMILKEFTDPDSFVFFVYKNFLGYTAADPTHEIMRDYKKYMDGRD